MFSILGAAHYYIWLQLVAPFPSPWRWLGTALVVVLAPTMPASLFVSRRMSRAAARPYLLVGYLWFLRLVPLTMGERRESSAARSR